jgi:hypothetical protein
MAVVALDLQEDEDDSQFMLCLLNYQSKTYMIRVIVSIDLFFHDNLPGAASSLSPLCSYQLNMYCVRTIIIQNGKCNCSSEEASFLPS